METNEKAGIYIYQATSTVIWVRIKDLKNNLLHYYRTWEVFDTFLGLTPSRIDISDSVSCRIPDHELKGVYGSDMRDCRAFGAQLKFQSIEEKESFINNIPELLKKIESYNLTEEQIGFFDALEKIKSDVRCYFLECEKAKDVVSPAETFESIQDRIRTFALEELQRRLEEQQGRLKEQNDLLKAKLALLEKEQSVTKESAQ